MENLHLFSPVTALRGIKEARAAQFHRLGIDTLYDLLAFFPKSYEDRTRLCEISQLELGVPACFEAMVVTSPKTAYVRKGLEVTRVTVADATGKLLLVFFNQSYLTKTLLYGQNYRFFGALQEQAPRQVLNPTFEAADKAGGVTGRLFPVYPLTAGLSGTVLRKAVRQALDACLDTLPEILPEAVRKEYGLCGVGRAYEMIHAPVDQEALEQARRRLVFEEFFIFAAGLSLLRSKRGVQSCPPMNTEGLGDFISGLPFPLTGAQQKAVNEILSDLSSGQVMNRMLQGDVGSGKTAVAACAAFCALRNGRQAVILAPTEILAEQHARSLAPLFARFGYETVLLTGALGAAQKRAVKEKLADGSAQLVIGTHALFTQDVRFHDLGLVVADEQHRFGVAQRAAMAAKGSQPHLLVMSATPIPRTLALIVYGDLALSVLDELPPGRQRIDTFLVGEEMRRRINAFINKECAGGGQTYIVCPAIEEGEDGNLKSAQAWAETLRQTVFPQLRVGLLHGKMKAADKDAVMAAFSGQELDILVSTTVIEVGVDVPNANVMVVENAERFGLSQLHQLRGRVGRGQRKSYCILFSSNKSADTRQRLKVLTETNDGFRIAEQDLALRGPGDFFGSRQSGVPLFKVASLQMDVTTLQQAQSAAAAALADPAWVDDPAFETLRSRIQVLFANEEIALN